MAKNSPINIGWSLPPSLWILFSCFSAGFIAEVARYTTLWGGENRFFDYAFPLWLSYGSMHIPGLVLGYAVLRILRRVEKPQLLLARYFFIGLFFAGLIADYDFERGDLHQYSPWLFVMVDGATLFLFSFFYIKPSNELKKVRARYLLLALLLPVLTTVMIRSGLVIFENKPVYTIWNSYHWPEKEIEVFWSVLKMPADNIEAECERLARFASDPYVFLGSVHHPWPKRHRIVLLFEDSLKMRSLNPTMAMYQLEWWPDNRSECRLLGRDYMEIQGLRGDVPRTYPWPKK